jgi:hypothetical protein
MNTNQPVQSAVYYQANRNDRFSIAGTLLLAISLLALGLLFREQSLNSTWLYENREQGMSATYPAGWLVEEGDKYVVRIWDPRARPFKTQFTVALMPASASTTIRNVLDALTLQRSEDFAAYRIIDISHPQINGLDVAAMEFVYVVAEPDPFFQNVPVVVRGRDITIADAGRIIVVTYIADQRLFETNLPAFQHFLESLRY